jgi:hypothetical protein
MVEVFGEAGRHARSAVGSVSLPLNVATEVEAVIELEVSERSVGAFIACVSCSASSIRVCNFWNERGLWISVSTDREASGAPAWTRGVGRRRWR